MYGINQKFKTGRMRFFHIFRISRESRFAQHIFIFRFYNQVKTIFRSRYGILTGLMIVLTGCAHHPEQHISSIQIPVAVSCVQMVPQKPNLAMAKLPDSATEFDKIQALTIDFIAQTQYINKLEAVVEGCLSGHD